MVRWRRGRAPAVLAGVVSVLALAGCGTEGGEDAGAATAADRPTARSSAPPWPAPSEAVEALVAEAGLDLGPMGTAEHYHPSLRIVVDGEQVPLAPHIGVHPTTGAMSAVHTHEGDGTIHVESDTVGEVFTLGQLFTQWDVALGEDRIGGVTADDQVRVTVNGRPVRGDPGDVRLRPEQEIVLELS